MIAVQSYEEISAFYPTKMTSQPLSCQDSIKTEILLAAIRQEAKGNSIFLINKDSPSVSAYVVYDRANAQSYTHNRNLWKSFINGKIGLVAHAPLQCTVNVWCQAPRQHHNGYITQGKAQTTVLYCVMQYGSRSNS